MLEYDFVDFWDFYVVFKYLLYLQHQFNLTMQILIIEDERSLRDSITEYLLSNGHTCTPVGTFSKGLEKSMDFLYDCVLVDVGLPDGNGIEIVKAIKKK